jgi:hypothetical protein
VRGREKEKANYETITSYFELFLVDKNHLAWVKPEGSELR